MARVLDYAGRSHRFGGGFGAGRNCFGRRVRACPGWRRVGLRLRNAADDEKRGPGERPVLLVPRSRVPRYRQLPFFLPRGVHGLGPVSTGGWTGADTRLYSRWFALDSESCTTDRVVASSSADFTVAGEAPGACSR